MSSRSGAVPRRLATFSPPPPVTLRRLTWTLPCAHWTPYASAPLICVPKRALSTPRLSTPDNGQNQRAESFPWPICAHPSPYDIFHLPRSAPYSKARFYDLVKLYHPDIHHAKLGDICHPLRRLPEATRLERYRLVVLANSILADPEKRRVYDAHGLGWSADPSVSRPTESELARRTYWAWRTGPMGGCAHNAGWEDWQRWFQQQQEGAHGDVGAQARPFVLSNHAYALLFLLAIFASATTQASRLKANRDRQHLSEKELAVLLSRGTDGNAQGGREERIRRFLRNRENFSYSYDPESFEHGQDRSSD